jgi:hypothetical protein
MANRSKEEIAKEREKLYRKVLVREGFLTRAEARHIKCEVYEIYEDGDADMFVGIDDVSEDAENRFAEGKYLINRGLR